MNDDIDLNNSLVLDPNELSTMENRSLIGRTVVDVHTATDDELMVENWINSKHRPTVVVFDDGAKLYASTDMNGSAPGELFLALPEESTSGTKIWHKQAVIIVETA